MLSVALRGLFSRKLRSLLTAIAIVLGVAMIAGTYILTDTINQSFNDIFQTAAKNTDVVIQGKSAVKTGYDNPPPSLPSSLLQTVQHTPGVAAAEGQISDQAQLSDLHGKNLGSRGGAPTLFFSVLNSRFRALSIVAGHFPHGSEVAVDESTFKRDHLRLGQTVRVASAGPARAVTVVGEMKFGGVGSIGGASLVAMDLNDAQELTGKVGKYDRIAVAAVSGVSPTELARRISARVPANLQRTVQVQSSAAFAQAESQQIGHALNFLTIALLAFGGIAVFVGAFIIFNTFSITVAQRTREFGLLRTLGATRRQVLQSVLIEAFLVGLVASAIGLLAGIGIARALKALFVLFNIDLPNTGEVLATRTVIVALLTGTIVTVASSAWPAFRATRVPPIAALREGAELPHGRWARFTPYIAGLVAALGVALLAYGVLGSISSTGARLSTIGFGAVLLFLGVAVFSPQLVPPLASMIGWPVERFTNITGRLARENAMRNPTRTAVTAAALMIGLALVGFVTIFAAELRASAYRAVDRELAGTYIIYNQNGQMGAGVDAAVRRVPGVQVVSALALGPAEVAGIGRADVGGIDPGTLPAVYRVQWVTGSNGVLTAMGPHDVIVDDTLAGDHKLRIGSTVSLTTPNGLHDSFRVTGIYKSSDVLPEMNVRADTYRHDWQSTRTRMVIVQAASGASIKALKTRIDSMLTARFPGASAHSQQDIKDQTDKSVNQLLALIYILLAMSIVVSLFGIVNTLVLSIYERTREIGMLRAIGTTRTQVRWLIRWESVITAVIGAILGLVLGIVLAALVTSGLKGQDITFTLPIGQLLIWVVFAVVFGIVAAAFPARRAARLDVLAALAYE